MARQYRLMSADGHLEVPPERRVGGEYDQGPSGITVTPGEQVPAAIRGMHAIGYRGYVGFELCHPLPLVNGKTVGLDFADKNARLAAEYLKGIIAEVRKQHA